MIFTMEAKLDEDRFSDACMPKSAHQLVFTFEKRHGKPVTLVGKFFIDEMEKKKTLKLIKTKLGTGGTIDGEWLEIQGDKQPQIRSILADDGWKFKKK